MIFETPKILIEHGLVVTPISFPLNECAPVAQRTHKCVCG